MSEKSHSDALMKRAFDRIKEDVHKGKWVILGIALFYLLFMLITYSTCPTIMITGIPCPFCGMTRAGFALLKGDIALAYELNPMIFGVLPLAISFIAVRYFTDKKLSVLKPLIVVFILLTAVVYIYRMITLFPDSWPMQYYDGNYLNQIFRK